MRANADRDVSVTGDAARIDVDESYEERRCRGIAGVLSRAGDKWSVLVVLVLGEVQGDTLRFNELKRRAGAVSQRMLTLTLRNIERDGLVTRVVRPTPPLDARDAPDREPRDPADAARGRDPRERGARRGRRRGGASRGAEVRLRGRRAAGPAGLSLAPKAPR